MRLFANANFDFIGHRRRAYLVSGLALAISIVVAVVWQIRLGSWLNYGVDFTGGTLVQVEFTEPTPIGDLRQVISPILPGSEIAQFGSERDFLIRAPQFTDEGVNVTETVVSALTNRYGEGSFTVTRSEAVGPKIGSELQRKAAFAILLSLAVTLIYLAFRFEWRFGVAAIISTAHDVFVTLGILSVFRFEVSLTTVAAVLTILGYSLNDTIVVFDRIRENLKASGRREEIVPLVNRSINETLPRTVLTSVTTLATLFALFVFGGGTIREFALILFLGVVIGTYSSIFIASPVLLEIMNRWKPKPKQVRPVGRPVQARARS